MFQQKNDGQNNCIKIIWWLHLMEPIQTVKHVLRPILSYRLIHFCGTLILVGFFLAKDQSRLMFQKSNAI